MPLQHKKKTQGQHHVGGVPAPLEMVRTRAYSECIYEEKEVPQKNIL
jgi:hypothetical protein